MTIRYLYEVSDYDGALQIIEIGRQACRDDQNSLQYSDLCNTAGVCYLEKNFLADCRVVLEMSLRIREELLPADDIESECNSGCENNLLTSLYHSCCIHAQYG